MGEHMVLLAVLYADMVKTAGIGNLNFHHHIAARAIMAGFDQSHACPCINLHNMVNHRICTASRDRMNADRVDHLPCGMHEQPLLRHCRVQSGQSPFNRVLPRQLQLAINILRPMQIQ